MKFSKILRSNFALNIIASVIFLMLLFGITVGAIGYFSFTSSFMREYSVTTFHMAETAATLVNADNIDTYLDEGGTSAEYQQTANRLDIYCKKMDVSLVYVIKVDTTDYSSFVSIFNAVNEKSPYSPWEIGYRRDATNEEYVETYRDLYEGNLEYGTIYRTNHLQGAPPHITTLVPVRNSQNEVVSVMCIQRPMEELISGRRPYLINVAISTVLAAILFTVIATFYIRREFVDPIKKVMNEAKRFAAENKPGEKLGDQISKIEDIAALARSIDKMEEDMLQYISNLTAITSEKERIGTELALASAIQNNSIPHVFPAFPDRKDFDIYATMNPAKEVGGDFYDFFLIDDDHLAIVIGDVAGKGVPAALFMMVTNILINEHAKMGGSPAEVLTKVNKRICEHNPVEMFVTLWLGVLELSGGKLIAANAGHEDPAVMHENGEFELFKTRHGIVIGAMDGIRYQDVQFQLHRGDKLFLYTDGVPEATDAKERMFGLERMLQSLNRYKDQTPRQIIDGIRSSVNAFVGDAPQFDDLTAVCLELKKEETLRLIIEAKGDKLPEVNAFVDQHLEMWGCSPKIQMQIDLAVEEMFVNIANYAYSDQQGTAEIILKKNNDSVSLTFIDSGIPYDPLKKPDPDTTLSAEDRQIGGLGIFLVKKYMDEVFYEYRDHQNVFRMTKRI